MPYVLHVAALASVGRPEEARMVLDLLRKIEPDVTVVTALRSARFADPERKNQLGDALRRAGLRSE
jgi:hypothetical protein